MIEILFSIVGQRLLKNAIYDLWKSASPEAFYSPLFAVVHYFLTEYMFAVLMHWRVRSLSYGPINLYVYEPQQNMGRGLRARKTGLSPQLFITDRSKAALLLWFILIVRAYCLFTLSLTVLTFFHSIYDSSNTICWEILLAFRLCCFILGAVHGVCVSVLFGVLDLFRLFDPSHEIMVLFVLRKFILQMSMHSHPVGLDVWFLVEPFVYFHTLCVRTGRLWPDCADAQARLSLCWSPVW